MHDGEPVRITLFVQGSMIMVTNGYSHAVEDVPQKGLGNCHLTRNKNRFAQPLNGKLGAEDLPFSQVVPV